MNLDAGEIVEDLRSYLSMSYPSVRWEVSQELDCVRPEPIIRIAARRHPFQPLESMVECSFRLWDSMDPQTGKVEAAVWSDWAMKTMALLQHS